MKVDIFFVGGPENWTPRGYAGKVMSRRQAGRI